MTTRLSVFATVGLCMTAIAANKAAPKFTAPASDGKTYNVQSLTAGHPVLIMFFSAGCPHNVHGIEDMNRLAGQLDGRMRLAGMTNLDAAQTRQFAHKYHARFPILSDVKGKTVAAFGAGAGLDNALILLSGEVAGLWRGYNQATIKELERKLADHGGPKLHLDLSRLPKDRQSGCMFM